MHSPPLANGSDLDDDVLVSLLVTNLDPPALWFRSAPGTAIPRATVPAPRAAVALPQWRTFSDVVEKDVVVPETVDTLEWVLDSPPPLHQFEESPIVVEVAVSCRGRYISHPKNQKNNQNIIP